jgi:hypothetical protein
MAPDRKKASLAEDVDRLEEIRDEIKALINEALGIFRDHGSESPFRGYAYAHIVCALDKDHGFLGGSFITLQDCIDELKSGG